jgi:tetratricopeptide (TPR) repeat protein
MSKHVCKNYGSCGKADSRELIEVAPGTDPLCECGFKLEASDEDIGYSTRTKKIFVGVGALAILVAAASYLLLPSPNTPGKTVIASQTTETPKQNSSVTGRAPDMQILSQQKKDTDSKILSGQTSSASATQNIVLAQEYIKAAIPFMQAGKWQQAEEQLRKAQSENPDESLVYYNLAIVKLRQAKNSEALEALELALKKGFRDFEALEADGDLKSLTSLSEYKLLAAKFKP